MVSFIYSIITYLSQNCCMKNISKTSNHNNTIVIRTQKLMYMTTVSLGFVFNMTYYISVTLSKLNVNLKKYT